MGTLHYGQHELHFEDRLLVHLQLVMAGKLRRQECFMMTWQTPVEDGSRRLSVWVNPMTPILFALDGDGKVQINRAWLNSLAESANSASGLLVQPEPTEEAEGTQDRGSSSSRASLRSVPSTR